MSAVTPLDLAFRRVLLTGAGSGIGRRLALELATRGAQLVLVGRHEQPLTETATMVGVRGGSAHVLTADLTAPGAPERVVGSALELLGGLDVLINNAGNVRAGRLDEVDTPDILAMLALNLTAPILLTKAALPHLRAAATAHGGAAVLGISSGIALVGLPFYATYAATKAGLARFDEALRRELIGTGIRVATAYPGATDTAMMATSQAGQDLGFGRRPVEEVAAEIVAGLEAGDAEINTSLRERRGMQDLNATAPLDVDAALTPKLAEMEAATRSHRSI
jgi:short-subunit dehydrogenase